jgi:hypothetical protein
MNGRIAWAASIVLAGGCVTALDEEHLERSRLGRVVEDCVVPPPAALSGWGAPVSVEYPDRSLWIWEEVETAGGDRIRNAAAFVTGAVAACSGDVRFVVDGEGAFVPLIGLTADEERENAERTDGRRVQVAVTGGFAHEGLTRLYYRKVVAGPGLLDAEVVGMGVCTSASPGAPCVRAVPGVHPEEPTLLWDRTERLWNRGAFVGADGFAYVWGCLHAAAFEDLCSLARVAPDEAEDPSAYRFAGWDGSWIDDAWNAGALLRSAGQVTPGFSRRLGRYVAVAADIWNNRIVLHRADRVEGGYGDPVPLLDAVPPDDWFIGGGAAHAALGAADGGTIVVSYFTSASGTGHGLHLVTFRFEEEW